MTDKCLFCDRQAVTYERLSRVRFLYDCDTCGEYAHSKTMRGFMGEVRAWAAANRDQALQAIQQANSKRNRLYFKNESFKR
jgi:hypothetical protein